PPPDKGAAPPLPALPPKPQEYCDSSESLPSARDDSQLSVLPPSAISPGHYALTEGGVRMRPMQLPEDIFEEFVNIAADNTAANLETCGVLCGRVMPGQNALVVTTLIIPKQHATSDTCTTESEEDLFVTQMDMDLMTLGWIHTHPSQTCFMSSLDLHTHCSYQLMLPEAIAIVCSPKHEPRFGIFRLTDPSGIDVIQNCREKSAFHPHDASKVIYTSADPDSHVVKARYDFEIIDLR
ncbi:Mov34-domain-containing protein, partial [Martensiomyces pterosporus]